MRHLERLRTGDDFDQLLGNLGLTGAVILQGQAVDKLAGIAGRVVHRGHRSGLLTGGIFQHRRQDLRVEIARQQGLQNFRL